MGSSVGLKKWSKNSRSQKMKITNLRECNFSLTCRYALCRAIALNFCLWVDIADVFIHVKFCVDLTLPFSKGLAGRPCNSVRSTVLLWYGLTFLYLKQTLTVLPIVCHSLFISVSSVYRYRCFRRIKDLYIIGNLAPVLIFNRHILSIYRFHLLSFQLLLLVYTATTSMPFCAAIIQENRR